MFADGNQSRALNRVDRRQAVERRQLDWPGGEGITREMRGGWTGLEKIGGRKNGFRSIRREASMTRIIITRGK